MPEDDGYDNVTPLPLRAAPEVRELPRRNQIQSDKITKAKARHRVLELAAAGLTAEQIAHETGKTERGVKTIINKQLQKWVAQNNESLAEYRQMKLFELDQLKRAIWPKALKGEVRAVKEAMKIVLAQASISGASAPQKHEHEHNVNLPVDPVEIRRMEQAWVDSAPAGELPSGETLEASYTEVEGDGPGPEEDVR